LTKFKVLILKNLKEFFFEKIHTNSASKARQN